MKFVNGCKISYNIASNQIFSGFYLLLAQRKLAVRKFTKKNTSFIVFLYICKSLFAFR